jgi:hypothetical protein
MAREADFISEVRNSARKVWEGILELLSFQNEWNALDYTNTLDDGTGENTGITKALVSAAVFDTADELKLRILDTAHKTNLAKLI